MGFSLPSEDSGRWEAGALEDLTFLLLTCPVLIFATELSLADFLRTKGRVQKGDGVNYTFYFALLCMIPWPLVQMDAFSVVLNYPLYSWLSDCGSVLAGIG